MAGWLKKIMKKIVLGLLLFFGTVAYGYATPKWLNEMFGCSWTWSSLATPKGTNDIGLCKYERQMTGTSWLWGSCGTVTEKYAIPCDADPNFRPIPVTYTTPNYQMIANEMAILEATNHPIDPDWKDTAKLRQDNKVLIGAISYKLELAGYTFDPIWLTLKDEPCPVPQPTNPILIPQNYSFINSDCTNNVTISPNPNSGDFNLEINNYQDIISLQVIRQSDLSSVLSLNNNFTENIPINLITIPGYHYIRIVTKTGVIFKTIMIQ